MFTDCEQHQCITKKDERFTPLHQDEKNKYIENITTYKITT
jgi:hypothetical protein